MFQGNTDSDTIVRHNFEAENVKRLYIIPRTWHNNVAFRFELYGCTMSKFSYALRMISVAFNKNTNRLSSRHLNGVESRAVFN